MGSGKDVAGLRFEGTTGIRRTGTYEPRTDGRRRSSSTRSSSWTSVGFDSVDSWEPTTLRTEAAEDSPRRRARRYARRRSLAIPRPPIGGATLGRFPKRTRSPRLVARATLRKPNTNGNETSFREVLYRADRSFDFDVFDSRYDESTFDRSESDRDKFRSRSGTRRDARY